MPSHSSPHPIPSQGPWAPRPLGFTLVELLVGLAVLAVLVAGAIPGLGEALDRRRLASLSNESRVLLQQARLEAQWRAEAVRVAVRPSANGASCLLLHTGASQACACPAADAPAAGACSGGAELIRMVAPAPASGLRLSLNVPSLRYDPTLGTTTPAGRLVVQGRGDAIHHIVNAMGRVRSCAPASASRLGLPPC